MGLCHDMLGFLFIEIGYADQQFHGEWLRPLRVQLYMRGDGDALVSVARLLRDIFDRAIETGGPSGTEEMFGRQALGVGGRGRLEVEAETFLSGFDGAGAAALGNGFSDRRKGIHEFGLVGWTDRAANRWEIRAVVRVCWRGHFFKRANTKV